MDNEVTQKISEYSKKISQLENEYQLTKSEFEKIEELYFKIFDGYLMVLHEKLSRDSVFKLNLSLINEDPKLMKEFTGWLKFEIEIFKKQDIKHYTPLMKVAEELLVLLKKEISPGMSEEKSIPEGELTNGNKHPDSYRKVTEPATEQTQPQTSNIVPIAIGTQTTDMEVHHHGHVHSQKKWKEYLFQFLMLFLAVTLGFVVENQREHYIEHQREKKFASLLYEDFKTDSALLNRIVRVKEWRKGKLDSLFYFFDLPDLQGNAAAIYYYGWFVDLSYGFAPSDATIQQLRSSGSLRYFRNQRLYNAITNYYSQCNLYQSVEDANNLNSARIRYSKNFSGQIA